MKVSIITVCFNSEKTIEDTITSVLSQSYSNIEFIIIDGASKDGTLKIIEKYRDKISVLLSEEDNGIYDAFNKGIKLATGDIVGILNSDDFYIDKQVISKIVNKFKEKEVDAVYADLLFINKNKADKIIRYWKAGEYQHGMFEKGWMPPHPTFFVKREMYKKYGYYKTSLLYSADYELMLRLLHRYKISTAYFPEVIIKMRMGGFGNMSIEAKIQANIEDRKAWRYNGLKPGYFTLLKKPISKISQFLKRSYKKN